MTRVDACPEMASEAVTVTGFWTEPPTPADVYAGTDLWRELGEMNACSSIRYIDLVAGYRFICQIFTLPDAVLRASLCSTACIHKGE